MKLDEFIKIKKKIKKKKKTISYKVQFIDRNKMYFLNTWCFMGAENASQFNVDLIKCWNEGSDEGYFLEVNAPYLKRLHDLHNDIPFLPERMKIEKVIKLGVNFHDKK